MISDPIPNLLRSYLEQSPVALALAAAEGDQPLLLVNEGFHRLTGFSGEDVTGRNCRFLQKEADNGEARRKIRDFLSDRRIGNLRTPIINFRKDGRPFVNLLYMSKLRGRDDAVRFIFASQFDISRTQPSLLADYDAALDRTLSDLDPALAPTGLIIEGSLMTIGSSAALIAQAKMTLDTLARDHAE
ncbi:PAS domain-containing protein [Acidisoma sp. 7E03]